MRIGVLGSGTVGRTVAAGLRTLGHEVLLGTREPASTMRREEFAAWARAHPDIVVAGFRDAAADRDLVVNALSGGASLVGIGAASIAAGTVLLDVSNPLDHSVGFPPDLFVANSDSLAEQLQRAFPGLRVVKSLHTMTAFLMTGPHELADGDFTTFVCGNDPAARQLVTDLLNQLGHRDVLDLGDLTAARGTEALMLVWLRLMQVLGTAAFTFKIVR